MIGIFENFTLIILLFGVIVYYIFYDIDLKYFKKERKCTKPTNCYHPVKQNQEVLTELVCPWSCSSEYSEDPHTCQISSIDNKCLSSTYGCCGDGFTAKTDEFGNNCLGLTGSTGSTGSTGGSNEVFEENTNTEENPYIIKIALVHQIYPACPNIQCPNESAFSKDVNQETLPPYPLPVVSEYTTFGL